MKIRLLALSAILGSTLAVGGVSAADNETRVLVQQKREGDRLSHVMKLRETRVRLAEQLGTGKERAHYRNTLEKLGYHITAVNSDAPEYLELEIVKDGESYEVQVDFKDGVSTFIEVTTNSWKAESTRAALKAENYRYAYPVTTTPNAPQSSDRVRAKAWSEEKPAVEKQLGVGHDRSYYWAVLKKMGYTVTTINVDTPDRLEMEAVKGDTSYEVKVKFDLNTLQSTTVDVSPNVWESDATAAPGSAQ